MKLFCLTWKLSVIEQLLSMKIKRILPSYKDVYLIKDSYLDKVGELEKDFNTEM